MDNHLKLASSYHGWLKIRHSKQARIIFLRSLSLLKGKVRKKSSKEIGKGEVLGGSTEFPSVGLTLEANHKTSVVL